MPHPIAEQLQFDYSSAHRSSGRRFARAAGEWTFVALSWITMFGLFLYPTFHIIALIGFSIWAVVTPDAGGRRVRNPW